MKKIIAVILVSLIISSCSILSKSTSDITTIKIDYKKNILEVDNYNGNNFNIEIINKKTNSNKYYASENIVVKKGSHDYRLRFNQLSQKLVDDLLKNPKLNTTYIYTSLEPSKDFKNAYSLVYKNLSIVDLGNLKGEVLFNSLITDNFFKVSGISSSRDGGVSNLEISTLVALDSDKTITIGGIPEFKESTREISPLECASMGTACDDGRNH
ncbi:hypothetical protein [Francisella philomiragia]|uniref:hypothetical protein n=1 Tax=Francisella philomiragia TaxID=28110 RepID=UPI001B8C2FA7|nr:hypothetical protein [Francisella philomiragia]QUE32070.1 hypothetical protein IMS64_03445 [Francisella philomiragia]